MPLTDAQIRQLQPKEKLYKTFDGGACTLRFFLTVPSVDATSIG
jgi:hypothetical protein